MPDLTFRDFAAAVMRGDAPAAAQVLETLLALDGADAATATAHFQAAMRDGGPAFMGRAMELRNAVASGDVAQISALLVECFGLTEPALARAVDTVRPHT
jgi:hypothetical protein